MNDAAAAAPDELLARTVVAAQNGDADAFARLVARFQDRSFALAYARLGGDFHLAQDAAQEAFVEAWLHLRDLHTPGAFAGWLRQIVLGKCVRLVRGSKARAQTLPLDAAVLANLAEPRPGPADLAVAREEQAALQRALFALPEHEREALALFYLGGFAYAEIAALQSVPLSTIRKRLYLARGRLRTLLGTGNDADLFAHHLVGARPSRQGDGFARAVEQRQNARRALASNERQPTMRVEVRDHSPADKAVIKNLYTFYRYDLMPFLESGAGSFVNQFGVLDGKHSRTHEEGVGGENVWWEKPGVLFAHLIVADDRPAGFVLIARPPHATPGVDYRMNEFFVLNKVRRQGVGTQAAIQILDRYPGKWEVAQLPNNPASVAFWPHVLDGYLQPNGYEAVLIGMGTDQPSLPGHVFDSSAR